MDFYRSHWENHLRGSSKSTGDVGQALSFWPSESADGAHAGGEGNAEPISDSRPQFPPPPGADQRPYVPPLDTDNDLWHCLRGWTTGGWCVAHKIHTH